MSPQMLVELLPRVNKLSAPFSVLHVVLHRNHEETTEILAEYMFLLLVLRLLKVHLRAFYGYHSLSLVLDVYFLRLLVKLVIFFPKSHVG